MKFFFEIFTIIFIGIALNACGSPDEQNNDRVATNIIGSIEGAAQSDDSNAAYLYDVDCVAAGKRDPEGFLVRRLTCTFTNPQTDIARRLSDHDVRARAYRITKGLEFYAQDGRMIIDLEASLPDSEQVRILKMNKVDIAMTNHTNHYDSLWALVGNQSQALFATEN